MAEPVCHVKLNYDLRKEDHNMRSAGLTRPIDSLGRIVVPKELRTVLYIEEKDKMRYYVKEDQILIRKTQLSCIFCHSRDQLVEYQDKYVCRDCLQKLEQKAIPQENDPSCETA